MSPKEKTGATGKDRASRKSFPNGKTPQTCSLSEIANDPAGILQNGKDNPAPGSNREQEYEDFFRLCGLVMPGVSSPSLAAGISGKSNGLFLLPLGFIPGKAVLLKFMKGQVRIVGSTPDVPIELGVMIPSPSWMALEELPTCIAKAVEDWQKLVAGLEHEPTPWNKNFAQSLLKGFVPKDMHFLAMGLSEFRWNGLSQAFGIVLKPAEEDALEDEGILNLEVAQVYNPADLEDVPPAGTKLSIEQIKLGGKNPLSKILRTWAKMESSFRNTMRR